ncbi:MAG TPA: DUF3566 domain-containing protein [Kribbella sp.]
MTNRARPTWPDGAGSAKKSPGTPPGANGSGQPAPPTTPASNGRTPAANGGTGSSGSSGNSGQGRPSTPAGQGQASRQPRPAPGSGPGSGSGQPNPPAKPVRPPQQPPVRPVAKQAPPAPTATPRPGQVGPNTPQRPESRLPGQTPTTKAPASKAPTKAAVSKAPTNAPVGQAPATAPPATPTYGQYGKSSSTTETIADRVTAAKQAVLGKAAAVREAATQGAGSVSRQGDAGAGTKPGVKASARSRTRKARLRLSRLDPWSVMKTAFLLSIAFGIVTWVAIFIVWSAIGAAGVFDNINSTVNQVLGSPSAEPFRIENYISTSKVMGFTTLLACADVLIITALATLGSFLYNIAATLLGGLEVTLASED